ncbi:hypothetical protein HK103_003762 [Boothiomyces macroporosus]|uniref:Uncharacterized protein n=1 Tax=Boothiomyces macroporosus TaxID=261099 RepID=A0AAD5UHI9_9FUNG|nr:hypothetical protein HK103_003762 [Boothiomyces macroporosus]
MPIPQFTLIIIIICIITVIGIGVAIILQFKCQEEEVDDMEIGNPVIDDNPLRSNKKIIAKYSQFTNQVIVKPKPIRAKEGSSFSQDTLFDNEANNIRIDTQPVGKSKLQLDCDSFGIEIPELIYNTSPLSVSSDHGTGYTPSHIISILNKA